MKKAFKFSFFKALFFVVLFLNSHFLQAYMELVGSWQELQPDGSYQWVLLYREYDDNCHPPMLCFPSLVECVGGNSPYMWPFGGEPCKVPSATMMLAVQKSLLRLVASGDFIGLTVQEDAVVSVYEVESGRGLVHEIWLNKNTGIVLSGVDDGKRYVCLLKTADGFVQQKIFFVQDGRLFEGV